jgi:hypothetical protein
VVGHANLGLLADVVDRVGLRGRSLIGDEDAKQIEVEVVVGKNHLVVGAGASVGPVDVAVEEVVLGRAKGRFDVKVELREDVVDLGAVGIVVWKQLAIVCARR